MTRQHDQKDHVVVHLDGLMPQLPLSDHEGARLRDSNFRPYALVADVKVGTRLQCGDRFGCLANHQVVIVEENDDGLYVRCEEGRHYLHGQIQFHTYIIGDGAAGASDCYLGFYLEG